MEGVADVETRDSAVKSRGGDYGVMSAGVKACRTRRLTR
jgi:hypothetical protein